MSFWSSISDWWNGRPEPPAGSQRSDRGGTAVLERPSAARPARTAPRGAPRDATRAAPTAAEPPAGEETACWWKPPGAQAVGLPVLPRPDLNSAGQEVEAGILRSLEETLSDPDIELPHLPHIPHQVLLLTRSETSNMRDIARLVSQDQVISADLLRRANSVAYGGASKVTALDAALARLGMKGIRSFMISRSVKQVTLAVGGRGGQSRGESLWRQSLASAYIMATLGDRLSIPKEEAFLLGLLHDIGKVVVLRSCAQVSAAVGRPVPDALFEYLCQEYHELMGEMIAEHWKLPAQLGQIIRSHHGREEVDESYRRPRAMIQATDAILALLGYAPRVEIDLLAMPAIGVLGLAGDDGFRETLRMLPEVVKLAVTEG